jgi:hypothetical protein
MLKDKSRIRKFVEKVKRLIRREPELPQDPYSYVGAPKKPKLPGRSAAAVADPDE